MTDKQASDMIEWTVKEAKEKKIRLYRDEKDFMRSIVKWCTTHNKTTRAQDQMIRQIYGRITGGGVAYRQVIA